MCDELTVLFDLAFVAFKSFTVIGDFDIAHIKPNYDFRVQHCLWVLPDWRADKKLRLVWLSYVLAYDELTL